MAIGYLTIQARTAHDAVPLSGVSITISNNQGNTVYQLATNENGEAQEVPLRMHILPQLRISAITYWHVP